MSDFMTIARAARTRLGQALAALQDPTVPADVLAVAEPIAQAMTLLHRVESSSPEHVPELSSQTLLAVRRALPLLQAEAARHPAVAHSVEGVAGALSLAHQLTMLPTTRPAFPHGTLMTGSPPATPPPASPYDAPATPPQAPLGYEAPAYPEAASFHSPTPPPYRPAAPMPFSPPPPAYAPPYQDPAFAPAYPEPAAYSPGPPPVAAPPPAPAPAVRPTFAARPAFSYATRSPEPPDARRPPSTEPPRVRAPEPGPLAPMPPAAGPYRPLGAPAPAPDSELVRVAAEMGAHSPTNFYKGLSGHDVIDAGGVFIATYRMIAIGRHVLIDFSMPGGYVFQAKGLVRWTREGSGAPEAPPGIGVRITEIPTEGRHLVGRYVKNREPLFFDDL